MKHSRIEADGTYLSNVLMALYEPLTIHPVGTVDATPLMRVSGAGCHTPVTLFCVLQNARRLLSIYRVLLLGPARPSIPEANVRPRCRLTHLRR